MILVQKHLRNRTNGMTSISLRHVKLSVSSDFVWTAIPMNNIESVDRLKYRTFHLKSKNILG